MLIDLIISAAIVVLFVFSLIALFRNTGVSFRIFILLIHSALIVSFLAVVRGIIFFLTGSLTGTAFLPVVVGLLCIIYCFFFIKQ